MVSRIKQLPTPALKLGTALVWGLIPAFVLVWFVYGVVGGIAYFQGWSLLHLFVWIWLALSIPGLLPGSLRETKANMSLVTALTGFMLPLPAYLHQVFPVPDNTYVPNSYTPPISYSVFFTEPLWLAVSLVLGLAIVIGGLRAYVALSRSETNVEPEIEEAGASRSIIGTIKRWFAFLLKLVTSIVLGVIPVAVLSSFVNFFEEGNPFAMDQPWVHMFAWIWVVIVILGLLHDSLKETLARLSLLTGLGGVLLIGRLYLEFVFGSRSTGYDFEYMLFWAILALIFFGMIAGGGLAGYIALTHPKPSSRRLG